MKNNFLKGLIMGIIGAIAAAFSEMETFVFAYVAIVAVIFTGEYLLKNWLKPSLSEKMSLEAWDYISGGLTAVFMGLAVYAGSLLTEVVFTWEALFKAVSVAFLGYLGKTYKTNFGKIGK